MKGIVDRREFVNLVKRNGYEQVRSKGSHTIFQNSNGRILTINDKPNKMVTRRLIKEYGLV